LYVEVVSGVVVSTRVVVDVVVDEAGEVVVVA
jgi:hypothetical protein